MATLIAVYNSEGCVGRCDARCYGATDPRCDCICGGMNHAAGKDLALSNTLDMAEEWLDRARTSDPTITATEVSLEVTTPTLF